MGIETVVLPTGVSQYTDALAVAAVEAADLDLDGVVDFTTTIPTLPTADPTTDDQAARKAYVDAADARLVTKVKTADEIVNNSNTLQNDDALVCAVQASSRYLMVLVIRYSSPTATPALKVGFTVPSGASLDWCWMGDIAGGSGGTVLTEASTDLTGTGSTQKLQAVIGQINVGVTAGNVQFQWAQGTATVEDTTIFSRSSLTLIKTG